MLDQVLKICKPEKGGHFIDCTFGSGGYTMHFIFPKNKSNISRQRSSREKLCLKKLKKL